MKETDNSNIDIFIDDNAKLCSSDTNRMTSFTIYLSYILNNTNFKNACVTSCDLINRKNQLDNCEFHVNAYDIEEIYFQQLLKTGIIKYIDINNDQMLTDIIKEKINSINSITYEN